MNMEKLLLHFKEAALQASISQASIELGVSQPAISKSIKLLEARYQTSLFERKARGVTLTPAGRILLDRVQRIENELVAITQEIKALDHQKTILKIGAGSAWEGPICNFLPNFYLKYPHVRIEVQSNTIYQLIPALLNDEIELAFGGEDGASLVKNNELSFTPMMKSRMCIMANKNHPLAQGQICDLEMLTQYPWVAFQNSKVMLDHLNQQLDLERIRPVNFILQTDFLQMALTMVKHSDALMCISNRQLNQYNQSDITEVRIKEPIWHYHLGVWSKSPKYRSQTALDFIEEIIKHV